MRSRGRHASARGKCTIRALLLCLGATQIAQGDLAFGTVAGAPASTLEKRQDQVCGDTDASGARGVTDALFVLQSAIGLVECAPCVCDIDDSGSHTAADALGVLRDSIELPHDFYCPPCSGNRFRLDTAVRCAGATGLDCAAVRRMRPVRRPSRRHHRLARRLGGSVPLRWRRSRRRS